jgi:phage-related protein
LFVICPSSLAAVGKGIVSGDVKTMTSGIARGAQSMGNGVGEGVESIVTGVSDGVLSVGQGLFSGVKHVGRGIGGAVMGKKTPKKVKPPAGETKR